MRWWILVLLLLTRRADAAEEESLSPEWNEICEFTLFAVVLLSLAVSQLDALVRNQRHIRKMVQGTYKVCCKDFTYLLSDGNPSVFPFRIMWDAYEAIEFTRYRALKRQHVESAQRLGLSSKAAPRILLQLKAAVLHPRQFRRWRELARHVFLTYWSGNQYLRSANTASTVMVLLPLFQQTGMSTSMS
eukprot:14252-Heterococcus_DN1.PRE.3